VPRGGPGQHCVGPAVQTVFQQIQNSKVSNKFQTISNFGRLENYFPRLRKIEIKYGFEDLGEMNNFLYRNFLKFGMDLE
jgi:hypothetical protein